MTHTNWRSSPRRRVKPRPHQDMRDPESLLPVRRTSLILCFSSRRTREPGSLMPCRFTKAPRPHPCPSPRPQTHLPASFPGECQPLSKASLFLTIITTETYQSERLEGMYILGSKPGSVPHKLCVTGRYGSNCVPLNLYTEALTLSGTVFGHDPLEHN